MLRGEWTGPFLGRLRFAEYGDRWITEHRLRARTRDEYRSIWCHHITPFLGHVELAELSTGTIRTWRATLLRQGRSEDRTAKAYRLLRAILNTAVDDGRIKRNPCRIKGAGEYRTPERPTATIAQVYALADQMPGRYRALVLAAAFTGLQWGELIALRRCDVDLGSGVLHVRRRLAQLSSGGMQEGVRSRLQEFGTSRSPSSSPKSCARTSRSTPATGRRAWCSAEGRARCCGEATSAGR